MGKEKEDAKANGISVDDSSYRYDIWARWKPEVDENFKGWIEKIKEDGTYDVKWPDGLSRNCKIDDLALKRITLRVKKAKKGKKKPDQNAYLNTNTEDESTSEKQKKNKKRRNFKIGAKKDEDDLPEVWKVKKTLTFNKGEEHGITVKANEVINVENPAKDKGVGKGWMILKIGDKVVEECQKDNESVAVKKILTAAKLKIQEDPKEKEDGEARSSKTIDILFQHELTEKDELCREIFRIQADWIHNYVDMKKDDKDKFRETIVNKWKHIIKGDDVEVKRVVDDHGKLLEEEKIKKDKKEKDKKAEKEKEAKTLKNKRLRYIEIERYKAMLDYKEAVTLWEKHEIDTKISEHIEELK